MVLESDVRPVENALVFFREVVDMYVKKRNHEKTKNLQFECKKKIVWEKVPWWWSSTIVALETKRRC